MEQNKPRMSGKGIHFNAINDNFRDARKRCAKACLEYNKKFLEDAPADSKNKLWWQSVFYQW
jgi:hypothetical protein